MANNNRSSCILRCWWMLVVASLSLSLSLSDLTYQKRTIALFVQLVMHVPICSVPFASAAVCGDFYSLHRALIALTINTPSSISAVRDENRRVHCLSISRPAELYKAKSAFKSALSYDLSLVTKLLKIFLRFFISPVLLFSRYQMPSAFRQFSSAVKNFLTTLTFRSSLNPPNRSSLRILTPCRLSIRLFMAVFLFRCHTVLRLSPHQLH